MCLELWFDGTALLDVGDKLYAANFRDPLTDWKGLTKHVLVYEVGFEEAQAIKFMSEYDKAFGVPEKSTKKIKKPKGSDTSDGKKKKKGRPEREQGNHTS